VFYEIFVGSFSDSNGDGIGDLRGIIDKFDYLNDGDPNSGKSLGIEGIWLSPIFSSPSYHKYDVTDYYTIDPKFGTQQDLDDLIALCHSRGVKLILDLVINHTARSCSWFGEFTKAHRQNDASNPYYDFYTYYKKGEQAPAGRAFAPLSGTDIYYECNFYDGMPELNFDNPAVREEILKLSRYYLDRGLDGFRFDAAKYVYFGDHKRSVEYWTEYLTTLRSEYPGLYTVAEVWDGDGVTDLYYPATNCFNFTVAQVSGLMAETAKQGNAGKMAQYVEKYLQKIQGTNPDAMFVPFLSNHDMDRIVGALTVESGNMQMAANLYVLGPGSPFLYYGEELGMRGSRGAANTDANRRLAMVWGDEDTVKDPEGTTYGRDKQIQKGAKQQMEDPNSLYNYYKKLIMIRKANPAIARGEYKAVAVNGSKVGGFTATLDGDTVLVLHNPSRNSQSVDLSAIGDFGTLRAVVGMHGASLSGTKLEIEGQTSVVLGK
ncbi:MAG: hypothetical protein IJI97_03590, partial [Clostridia bacterium]|nr:hypothetical protein [Clostridia bacterium]